MKRAILFSVLTGLLTLSSTVASAAPPSGMLLGVYAFPNWQGLRITGTIPGYAAHGRLYRDDVLLRVTADGVNIHPTRNLWQIEQAKDAIGPFRQASLEIFRPGVGLEYLWVEFRPVGGVAAKRGARMEAKIMTEKEKPGARALFHGGANGGFQPQPEPQPQPAPSRGSDPSSLFQRRN